MNDIKNNKLFKLLLDTYIKNELSNMFRYINYKYKKEFTHKDVKKYINKYVINEKIKYNKYIKTDKNRFYKIVKKKIFIRKFRNSNISKGLINNSSNKNESSLIFDNTKCYARVWNDGSIIKLENGNIVYGKQCQRKKKDTTNYCGQHIKNNKHADFNKIPSEELITHYTNYQE